MRKRYLCLLFPIIIAAVISVGCATNNTQQEDLGKTPIVQKELPDVEKARVLIAFGSPETLREAYELLRSSFAGNSPEGQKLVYIAEQMMQILYPRIPFDAGVSLEPSNSDYPEIFEDVRQGQFSILMQNWDSTLMLHVVSCAALYTNDNDVLTLCGAAARAALRNGATSESVLSPYILGIIEEKRENYKDALEYYKESYKEDSSVYPAKWNSVRILRATDENGKALSLLKELVQDFPDDIEFQLELCSCYLDLGSVKSAL